VTAVIGRIAAGRRIAILVDVLVLGPDEPEMHAGLAALSSMEAIHLVHCVGPRMRALYEALPLAQRGQWVENAGELARHVHRLVDAGDVILVKGSKGSRVSEIATALRKLAQGRREDEGV